jgi:hypothetical protein
MEETMKNSIWIGLGAVFFLSCSDFNLGYTPGGDPRPPIVVHDTLVDTLIVPADSLIVYARYARRDTILNQQTTLRSNNTLELRITSEWSAEVDTLGLFGLAISEGLLDVRVSRDSTLIALPDSLKHTSAGGLDRYEVFHRLSPESEYAFRWTNVSEADVDIRLEMLLGYASSDSTVERTTTLSLRELGDVVKRSKITIPGKRWRSGPVIPFGGHSIQIRV